MVTRATTAGVRMAGYARILAVAAAVVVVDQLTKHFVRAGIDVGESHKVIPGVHLVHVRNTGVAFSLFSGGGTLVLVFTFVALAVLVGYFTIRPTKPWLWLPTGLLIGGAIGNLIDRVAHGAVTDFIKLPHWPAFNVSDIAITFGVVILVFVLESGAAGVMRWRWRWRWPRSRSKSRRRPRGRGLTGSWPSRWVRALSAASLIDADRVRVDGQLRRKRHTVVGRGADRDRGPSGFRRWCPRRGREFGIAYEDEYLIVVDKPAGVVVHPARGHWTGTLAQALEGVGAGGEEPWRAGIVHRLDRDTSGLLVVAKNDEVHRKLKALITRRELHREYVALVDGRPSARTGTIDAPIGRSPARSGADVDRRRRGPRGADALRDRAPASDLDAAAGDARDRAHPPDPGAHGGDRPSGVRGPAVRDRWAVRARAAVPARAAAGVRSPGHGSGDRRVLAAARGSGGRAGRGRGGFALQDEPLGAGSSFPSTRAGCGPNGTLWPA